MSAATRARVSVNDARAPKAVRRRATWKRGGGVDGIRTRRIVAPGQSDQEAGATYQVSEALGRGNRVRRGVHLGPGVAV
jgi:hypothetical protein